MDAPERAGDGGLSDELVALRIERFRDEVARQRRCGRWAGVVLVVGMAAYAGGRQIAPSPLWGLAELFTMLCALSLWVPTGVIAAVRRLGEIDDPRAIGPLADALASDITWERPVLQRITALLPRLKASDGAILNKEHRAALCTAMGMAARRGAYEKERDFIVAALGGLEQLGGEECLPFVQALADSTPRDKFERQIVDAAQACLPALRQRAGDEQAAAKLLRPADAPSDASVTLLRPAAGIGESDPALLLRAGQPDPTSTGDHR